MAFNIICIVEGDGEVRALPLLLRRLLAASPEIQIPSPIRVPAQRFLRDHHEFARTIELAIRLTEGSGAILVLLDLEDECPATNGPELQARLDAIQSPCTKRIVFAYREFETWFIQAATSLAGRRNLRPDLITPGNPEAFRDAKGWLSNHMTDPRRQRYNEVLDQPALASLMDLDQARHSDSFRKFEREVKQLQLLSANQS